ncbi:uncharacterized protein [Oryza sativa Japonica Group]|nr:uncharacterized protein LOC112937838 [Oryza sativa Japonica Group]XP_052145481.1 uncharacterized protein LOC127764620 [Oryza glaberrima]
MPSQSSPQTLNGKLKLNTSTTILLFIVFLFTLCIISCEARHDHLRISDKYSSKKSSLVPKDVAGDDVVGSKQPIDQSVGKEVTLNAKMELAASSGSSSGSLNKRFEGTKVRSVARERSVLGAETNREQVGSKPATTAYTAETLAAMDYPVAHTAPAVHNR